ncbi:MAG: UDP-N-acetylmuramoyl-L-alanyl-D-glutamate--2,6-diaminopimelate ligase [Rhabdochlamydiaceae bacterium]|nr:UDP-N-acetylmuramoyl-L-alanyl-D-glutamate--2,6-diaminopimelate ligase [Rhabdochlamydiaceae bacterium]
MKLKQLVKGIPSLEIKGSKDVEILGLCNNSQFAAPGYLFFAKKGSKLSGNQFIRDAALAGSVAIATDLFDPFLKQVVQIVHPDVTALESLLTERFYDYPSHQLLSIGITGTNGKTTCSYLIKHFLDRVGIATGLIGTIEWIIKDKILPSNLTTPDAITSQKLLHEMKITGCQGVVMEVSSHALVQKRVACIDFDIAIFTNLTQDHLDYHETMEEYAKAKAILFSSLGSHGNVGKSYPKLAIVNCDSPWASTMIRDLKAPLLTYGLCQESDVRAEEIKLSPKGSSCWICYRDLRLPFTTALIGKFNIYNYLAVIATAIGLNFDLPSILSILSSFPAVPGRLERVENQQGKNIFVDYAHTEDALKNVLEALREIAVGRVLCVFGCGGNRDKQKRPKMGAVAEKLSDALWITSDNPRGESPESIIQDILAGIQDVKKVCIEVDRRKAIEKAISQMKSDDVLLIAGKGHENYQVFSHHTIHFDDRIIAKEYCRC